VGTIKHLREIEAWQRGRDLAKGVYTVSGKGPFARDFALKDQMRRAAISVMANIADGFERGGNAEFIQFLSVAKGSAGEVEAQLYVALDQKYIVSVAESCSFVIDTVRLGGGVGPPGLLAAGGGPNFAECSPTGLFGDRVSLPPTTLTMLLCRLGPHFPGGLASNARL